jgi:Cu2+-exporting ATPase
MTSDRCQHCHRPLPPGAAAAPFCCRGCEAVYGLLIAQGLGRYYELAGASVAPAPPPSEAPATHGWLEPLLAAAAARGGGRELCELRLDVQGIHCSACVWLLQETFRRREGGGEITVNPALGQIRLRYDPARFAIDAWVRAIEAFGYRFGPPRKEPSRRSIELPLRLGISAALTVNVMLFSVSFYFGLAPDEPQIFRLFSLLSLALSSGVVAVGGWPFFRSAWQGLRRGLLHLDLPIALGIVLVFVSSLARMRHGRGDWAYFDTLDVFITLMLAGRFLQERLLERNRKYLLEDDGAEGIVAHRIEGDRLVAVNAPRLRAGDRLLVAPGELVPLDGLLANAGATISLDWITGESEPLAAAAGDLVPAGSFNAGRGAIEITAASDFADSPLVALLRQPEESETSGGPHARLWDRLARIWVGGVTGVAVAGFLFWLPSGVEKALAVASALLVVTCPCAIGIALPLAYELTFQRLRRAGAFVRGGDLLDRLPRARKILFDKTGTLTLGRLELEAPDGITRLDAGARDAAYNLAARSTHPVSRALAAALERAGARFEPTADVIELPGAGVEGRFGGALWRLGHARWAAPAGGGGAGAVLSRDGSPLATFATREVLRPDAQREVARLEAQGFEIWLVSGDDPARVARLARALAIPPERAVGGLAPEEKAALVERLDADDTLYLGDGVNDALAFASAYAAGTPAIDRPVMPGRSDFFLVGEGLAPLAEMLAGARRLRRLVRRLLAASAIYNLGVVAAALAGLVSPVVAAIVMPASTLSLLAAVAAGLATRREPATRRPLIEPAAALP